MFVHNRTKWKVFSETFLTNQSNKRKHKYAYYYDTIMYDMS